VTRPSARETLHGRTVVITGASRGLGAGLARRFAELGASTGLCARALIDRPGTSTVTAVVDVTDAAAVDEFASAVVARLGPIDLWINNAGAMGPVADLRDVPPDEASTVVSTNILGVLHGTQSYLRHRREAGGGGVLVNLSSGAAHAPQPGLGLYCATKSAVQMLTDVVNAEEGTGGLRAYAVEPGAVDTDMMVTLRAASAERFESVAVIRALKEAGRMNSTGHVADHIAALAFGSSHAEPGAWRVPSEHSR
jgi:NAD(P)-dependent dehydrogenase (short-subunit alcohol dehydrogenase family)